MEGKGVNIFMKRKFIVISIVTIVMVIAIFIQNNYQSNQGVKKKEVLIMYEIAAVDLHLDLNPGAYENTGDPEEIVFTSTKKTENLLERWEAISNVFPTINFPKRAVEQEDWIKVYKTLASNRKSMEDVSTKLAEGADEPADWQVVNDYIHSGEIPTDYFRNFLEREGIDDRIN